jgi:kinesin family member 26
MLRVSDNQPEGEKSVSYLSIDKKKRQVTLSEPTSAQTPQSSTSAQERAPMVSAPKMFAFDAMHTSEDSQVIRQSVFTYQLEFPQGSLNMKNCRC